MCLERFLARLVPVNTPPHCPHDTVLLPLQLTAGDEDDSIAVKDLNRGDAVVRVA
jgi:hypothetical protein